MFYNGAALPDLKGNFLFGCLRGTRIIRVILDGRKVVSQENMFEGTYGRIREMEKGPDGYIYFSTSNRDGRGSPAKDDDRIMRIVPLTSGSARYYPEQITSHFQASSYTLPVLHGVPPSAPDT